MTHCLLKPSATARGTFWSRRTASRSATPDDLLLVDHAAGIVERADHVLPHQLRIRLQDSLDGVSASDHAEDALQHDAGAANNRLAAANRRIYTDSVFHRRTFSPRTSLHLPSIDAAYQVFRRSVHCVPLHPALSPDGGEGCGGSSITWEPRSPISCRLSSLARVRQCPLMDTLGILGPAP